MKPLAMPCKLCIRFTVSATTADHLAQAMMAHVAALHVPNRIYERVRNQ